MSLGNISITDDRSTDIHEESSINNYSNNPNMQGMTPYKTVNSFNNLKSITKSNSKLTS